MSLPKNCKEKFMRLFNLGLKPHSKGLSFSESTGALKAKSKIKVDKRLAIASAINAKEANIIID